MPPHQRRQHVFSNRLFHSSASQVATPVHDLPSDLDSDASAPSLLKKSSDISTSVENEQAFDFEQILRDLVKRRQDEGIKDRQLGVMFKDLRVVGAGSRTSLQPTVGSPFHPSTFLYKIREIRHPPIRDILSGFEGLVTPGEMLLVLGRPGSGCSTFLKTLANQRGEYHAVEGQVFYDSFTPKEIHDSFRGDVTYCPEDDVHFPTLTVNQTLSFAIRNRTPATRFLGQTREDYVEDTTTMLMKVIGLYRSKNALVGNAQVQGVSGGERKRVSIAETLGSAGSLCVWDNSTRGLDSSTALEFVRTLRSITDVKRTTTIVSLYQAGERLYDLFDKVCIIAEGKMAYFGSAKSAKGYFIDMGFEPQNRQTTPDFLVSVTDANGRKIRPGYESFVPRTSEDLASRFIASDLGHQNRKAIEQRCEQCIGNHEHKQAYLSSAAAERASTSTTYVASIPQQVKAVMKRRLQVIVGDKFELFVQLASQVFQAIILGTVFLNVPNDTSAYFSRAGVLFFSLFFSAITSIAEVPALFFQRPIVLRHQKAALHYPFIQSLAHTVVDIPITLVVQLVFAVILYFLVGLQRSAAQFFIFYLFIFLMSQTMKSFFRAIAASFKTCHSAIAVSGIFILLISFYGGYAIPWPTAPTGLRWIMWMNPLWWGFSALVVNEFHTLDGICSTLVPQGPGYENVSLVNQVCTTAGSQPGQLLVDGNIYVGLTFDFWYGHLWRNFGVICAFHLGFLAALLIATECNTSSAFDGAIVLFKPSSNVIDRNAKALDEEEADTEFRSGCHSKAADASAFHNLEEKNVMVTDIFTWQHLQYEVPFEGGMKRLLDDVTGFVAPGKLTALMGESGAGKTTLLNVLAQRIAAGVVGGDRFVNGQPLPTDFRAQMQAFGYCQQLDTHLPEATVREALLFSANLRQPQSVPLTEKEAYVDKCLQMCGLEGYADAIVGSLGVEYRKRTTIAVELAAKPKLLLFLDEPTSGLDSQSAWAIVQFLRELADHGQAILCTIHQPSAELFQVFDRLLLLCKGGQTVYFGDIGEDSSTVLNYFERNGAPRCGSDANPAEYMLDVIGARAAAVSPTDWYDVWRRSSEARELQVQIGGMHESGRTQPQQLSNQCSVFATSWSHQFVALTQRNFRAYWRAPAYVHAKFVLNIAGGLLVGFTFFQANDSLQGTQNKLFSIFLILVLSISLIHQLMVVYIDIRTVYEIRERPSRMYHWTALVMSQLAAELPWNMISSAMFFFCCYWTVGYPTGRAGYSFLMLSVAVPLYYTTLGHGIASMAPNASVASLYFTTLIIFVLIFDGVIQPFMELNWWKWMYRVSPFTYIIEGLLGQAIGGEAIRCSYTELVSVNPPKGLTCGKYMGPFMQFAGGYLTNPEVAEGCQYCPYTTTDQFMYSRFNIAYSDHWRDLGIVFGFVAFNIVAVFWFTYFMRIRTISVFASLRQMLTRGQ
ncbi:ABC-2 type transporter-domain-containing protein [Suillus clintonianus]|uniref:ABC-2 type transporter-domain-containing protein n=1 Tax=Suillus clintonianus TaxID=1904413 RepID=UPI001B861848|nr:ABC-2 type transporter-domain-containing protein [Suillus clintonianus]KAG2154002.1 ABC-2 type transporter-domain-containing protein [Suillus clintonianus]